MNAALPVFSNRNEPTFHWLNTRMWTRLIIMLGFILPPTIHLAFLQFPPYDLMVVARALAWMVMGGFATIAILSIINVHFGAGFDDDI